MNEINTFVFFDLETTGLPQLEFGKTKITEISLIAVTKQHILEAKNDSLPRALSKLTLCFNPQKRIHLKSEEMTGLSNELLEKHSPFDENALKILTGFFQQQQQPVCLCAHNGNRFDFILLRNMFEKFPNVKISDSVFCIDTLQLFRDLDNIVAIKDEKTVNQEQTLAEITELEANILSVMENLENEAKLIPGRQQSNETTPHRDKVFVYRTPKANSTYSTEVTPTSSAAATNQTNRIAPKSKRKLFPDSNEIKSTSPTIESPARKLYNLSTLYKRLIGEELIQGHYAENDVIALLKCAIACNKDFIKYTENNCVSFVDFKGKF
uniref:Putative three prime repair exonuclease 1 n=1 Tax=Corethrella appendiculata TaxID=1370023 RepID=U5EQW5_9DIPT